MNPSVSGRDCWKIPTMSLGPSFSFYSGTWLTKQKHRTGYSLRLKMFPAKFENFCSVRIPDSALLAGEAVFLGLCFLNV